MINKTNTDLKVGITVLVGILILVFGISWAKNWHFGSSEQFLVATFPSASGLERGDGVFVRGVKHGTVDQIIESGDGKIVVRMVITEPALIHRDASAIISMLELMGGKKVDISPGLSGSFNLAKDTIVGSAGGDISSLISFANSMTGSVQTLVYKVDTVLNNVNDIFGNGALKQKTYAAIDNASAAILDVRGMIKDNREMLRKTLADVDNLAMEANNTVIQLRPGVASIIDSVKDFIHHSQGTLLRADTLLSGINTILAESHNNKSVLYKLTSDKEFSNHMDSVLGVASKLLRDIQKNGMNVNVRLF